MTAVRIHKRAGVEGLPQTFTVTTGDCSPLKRQESGIVSVRRAELQAAVPEMLCAPYDEDGNQIQPHHGDY